jgi:MFS family permease
MIEPGLGRTLRLVLPFGFGFMLADAARVINAVVGPGLATEMAFGPATLGLVTAAFFLAFAAAQLPAGSMLDRFGPRRVNALLFVVAALGAFVFALAEDPLALGLGRALLGAGFSMALMAGFQAFARWFGHERAPRFNCLLWCFGAVGSLAATAPLRAVLDTVGWRPVFMGLAASTLLAAALLAFVVPERPAAPAGPGNGVGFGAILGSPRFWTLAPITLATQAVYLSVPGLWASPWLADTARLVPDDVATALAGFPLGMLAGFLGLSAMIGRFGVTARRAADVGTALFLVLQCVMIVAGPARPFALCLAFGALGGASSLYYPEFARAFPLAAAGRANTTLNLAVFLGAFAAQGGMLALLGLWPAVSGARPSQAYGATLGLALLIEAAAYAWLLVRRRSR